MNENNITIEFSKDEVQALLGLIDLAVKSGGLQVAEAAVVLSRKIAEAVKPKEAAAE
mgnify:CR=1 FL=1